MSRHHFLTRRASLRPRGLRARRRSGSALVMTALGLVGLVGACALAVDYSLLVSDANKLQRALDAAALAGAQDLKRTTDSEDEAKARDTAALAASQNGVSIDKARDITFENNSAVISISSTTTTPYHFARIFNLISPGSVSTGSVNRRAKARVSTCQALKTPRVVPIGITWETYGGLDGRRIYHGEGYRNDWVLNRQFLAEPHRMIYRTLTLTRQNATVFGKDDAVLFDLRNSPSKSGAHFVRQITGDVTASALSSIGDVETTLNASDHSQGGRLAEAFSTIFERAAASPWNDATSSPMIDAVGVRYPDLLAITSPLNSSGQPNPRVMNLVITSAPMDAPVSGSWNTTIEGYAPVYVRRAYATVDAATGDTLYKMDVGILPPQTNSDGTCDANTSAAVSGQRVISLIQ